MADDTCTCGHVEDEHDVSWLAACTIDGCPCLAFDPADVWETATNIDPDDPNP